jgi:hypothetical protein
VKGARTLALIAALAQSACSPGPLDAIALAPTTLTNGMVAHWTFDDGAGTTVRDHSGNNRDGQLSGGTWITDGRFGGAVHLAAGDSMSAASFPNATSSWTVSTWVRLTDSSATTESYKTVVSTENMGGWEINIDRAQATPGAHFGFWKGPAQGDYYGIDCYCMAFQRWTHIASVVDGDALTASLYVDGTLKASTAITRAISPGSPTLYVGRWINSGRLLVGDVDDVVIYNRALVREEVVELGQAPPPDVP